MLAWTAEWPPLPPAEPTATASPAAETTAPGGRLVFRTGLQHGFARKVNPALLIDFHDLHFDFLAFFDFVFGFFHKMIRQLTHPDQTFFARHDLNEHADAQDRKSTRLNSSH